MISVLVLLLAVFAENRLFLGRVELAGPLDEVRFDCGAAGEVRLEAKLFAGERRSLELPFPVRSPLGVMALAEVPPPRVVDPSGGVRFLGWAEEQPATRFERLGAGLTTRTRPPLVPGGRGRRRGLAAGFALAVAAGFGVLALKRKGATALGVGLAGGALAAFATAGAGKDQAWVGESVMELEAQDRAGLLVRSGVRIELDEAIRLEAEPADGRLSFELHLTAQGLRGLAWGQQGARLTTLAEVQVERAWRRGESAPRTLERVWTRGSDGGWAARGRWEEGTALPAPLLNAPPPPGWLAAGLPAGRGVLVGEFPDGEAPAHWVRIVGF